MDSASIERLGKVLIVGGGRMGSAIAQGILNIDAFCSDYLTIANPGADKRSAIERSLGIKTVACAKDGLPARTIILAVKPNIISDAAASLAEGGLDQDALIISIAAGVSTSKIEGMFDHPARIIRVMPNTPLIVGCGMSALSSGAHATDDDCALACALFEQMGKAVVVPEREQDAVCAVSGSGPAYFELFAQCIAAQGERLGLRSDTALELAMQTMLGTAVLIDRTGQSLDEAIRSVCSPGGTTIAALDAMRALGVEEAIAAGVEAAAVRSEELGA